ncbi:hypothetical protein YC2023_024251 [Brassica napus]
MNNPSLDLHISIPRKYFISPKSLISNMDLRNSLVAMIPSLSLPVIMISSTYTRSAIIPEVVVRVKRVWSSSDFLKPRPFRVVLNLLYQALGDCFNP